MSGKKTNPWDRLEKEGMKAYELFLYYLSLGSSRGRAKVAEDMKRKPRLVADLCHEYKWSSRSKAYDEYLVKVQQDAIKKELERDAVKRAQRMAQQRDTELDFATKLMQRANAMLDLPMTETEVTRLETIKTVEHPEGEEIAIHVTIKPLRATFRDMMEAAKTASAMARLSMEMEQSRETVAVDFGSSTEHRLEKARAVLKHLQSKVDAWCERDPRLDRAQVMKELPEWTAGVWQVDVEQLETPEEQELPALSLDSIALASDNAS